MLDWSQCSVVKCVPGKVSGTWVFKGTPVPVHTLFENLESGACLDDFLKWFPGVTHKQIVAVLAHAEHEVHVWRSKLAFPQRLCPATKHIGDFINVRLLQSQLFVRSTAYSHSTTGAGLPQATCPGRSRRKQYSRAAPEDPFSPRRFEITLGAPAMRERPVS